MAKVLWKSEPEEHAYPAAAYLSLLAGQAQVAEVVTDIPCRIAATASESK